MIRTYWHRDAHEPTTSRTELRVSSLRVSIEEKHWIIAVWNRGGRSGELAVLAADGPAFVDALLPPDVRGRVDESPLSAQ
jgi:hypothetical protein